MSTLSIYVRDNLLSRAALAYSWDQSSKPSNLSVQKGQKALPCHDPLIFFVKIKERCTHSWMGLWRWHVDSHCPAETKKKLKNQLSLVSSSHSNQVKALEWMSTHWQISHWLEPFVRNQASMHDLWDLARPPRHRHPSSIKASSFSCWQTLLTIKKTDDPDSLTWFVIHQFTFMEPS